ncbi:MAG: TetR family transcriptional regulator [Methylovirgula sp.]
MAAEIREKRSGELTRQRILRAALARFADASYEEVGLRDIAADVGIDVALVHRSFGSKEQLFSEVVKAAVQAERLLAFEKSDLSTSFAKNIFEPDSELMSGHAEALQIFIHSLSSPRAREVLRAFAWQDFIEPLAAKLDDRAQHRATLFVACLIGIRILRDVLGVEPLLDASRAETQPLIEKILDVCLDDSRATVPATAGTAFAEQVTRLRQPGP